MITIGCQAHAESRYAAMPYAQAKLEQNLKGLFALQEQGTHCVLLAQNSQEQIVGGLIGAIEEPFFTQIKCASTILIWVDPKYRGTSAALKLLNAFKQWAQRSGAQEVCIVVASGVSIAKTDRFLTRMGFRQTGGNYAMALQESKA